MDSKKKYNKTRERDKLAQWIVNDRMEMRHSDIDDVTYPLFFPYLSEISPRESGTVFALNQQQVLMKAYRIWGLQEEVNDTTLTMNTRARLFGILFMDDNRGNSNMLVENRAG